MKETPDGPKYTSSTVCRNGKVKGNQRYKCKNWVCQFTRTSPRGRLPAEKALALTLYLMGDSMNVIGRLLKVSTLAVLNWIKNLPSVLIKTRTDRSHRD